MEQQRLLQVVLSVLLWVALASEMNQPVILVNPDNPDALVNFTSEEYNGSIVIEDMTVTIPGLENLNNLKSINGSLLILNNPILKEIDFLTNLWKVSDEFTIVENPKLEKLNLPEFHKKRTIYKNTYIYDNSKLCVKEPTRTFIKADYIDNEKGCAGATFPEYTFEVTGSGCILRPRDPKRAKRQECFATADEMLLMNLKNISNLSITSYSRNNVANTTKMLLKKIVEVNNLTFSSIFFTNISEVLPSLKNITGPLQILNCRKFNDHSILKKGSTKYGINYNDFVFVEDHQDSTRHPLDIMINIKKKSTATLCNIFLQEQSTKGEPLLTVPSSQGYIYPVDKYSRPIMYKYFSNLTDCERIDPRYTPDIRTT